MAQPGNPFYAALERVAITEVIEGDFAKRRHQRVIEERARQELAKEEETEMEIARIKSVYGDKKEVTVETPGQQNVLFRCDLLGGSIGTRKEIKAGIREFLFSKLEEEKSLTAISIIQSCNSPRDRVTLGVESLCRILQNILNDPAELKFRKIRKTNKAFSERVASLEGATLNLK